MLNWEISRRDASLISAIADKAIHLADTHGMGRPDKLRMVMDVSACHCNGCPLKLEELSKADDFNLMHDVFGIQRHINRLNGKLEGCFLPRYAAPETDAEDDTNCECRSNSYTRMMEGEVS